jgi:hypothetical protein
MAGHTACKGKERHEKRFRWDNLKKDLGVDGRIIPKWMLEKHSRVEAGSNTSTVALRVVGGDEKRTQCLGV